MTADKGPRERFSSLDALRGIAALTVVFGHLFNVVKPEGFQAPHAVRELVGTGLTSKEAWLALFELPPLRLFVAGHEAVVLFFILSGFVLSLQFERDRPSPYPLYAAKRICRIYLPYLGALALAICLNAAVADGPISSLNAWVNQAWTRPIDGVNVAQHVGMIGTYAHSTFNVAFWSLIHEMRISLLFPLLLKCTYLRTSAALLSVGALSAGGISLDSALGAKTGDYLITIHYAGLFGIGALIAKNRRILIAWWGRLFLNLRILLTVLGVGAYCCGTYTRHFLRTENLNVRDIPIAAGAGMIIVLALSSPSFIRVLSLPVVQLLGRTSFSLYLVHATVLFALLHLLYPSLSLWIILPSYVLVSLALAQLMYRWIEVPSMALGRRLARSWPWLKTKGSRVRVVRENWPVSDSRSAL